MSDQNIREGVYTVRLCDEQPQSMPTELNSQHSLFQQEDVAFFSYPFSFEAFYMCEKESEGWCRPSNIVFKDFVYCIS